MNPHAKRAAVTRLTTLYQKILSESEVISYFKADRVKLFMTNCCLGGSPTHNLTPFRHGG